MEDSASITETKDKLETKEIISLAETEEKVSSAETKEKVSVAVAKEKVSHAAAKGGKAFMSLIHMAKHPSKEHKSNGSPSEHQRNLEFRDSDGDSDELTMKPPNSSLERKAKKFSDDPLPNSPKTSSERKEKLISDELSPNSPKSSLERKSNHPSDEPTPNSPKSSMERKAKLVNKLKQSFKGKKSTDADNGSQLLDGNLGDPSPRVRSADSIKVAYGHKPSTDPTSIAALTREKLIERQEKLQAMNNQSEELQDEAGIFASMAGELAKKIENKKWYQL